MFFHFVPRHEDPLLSTRGVSHKKKKNHPDKCKDLFDTKKIAICNR